MAYLPAGADALRVELSAVEVTHLVAVGTVPGVAVLAAAALNGPGAGRLRTNAAGTALQWRAPGSSTWGAVVTVATDDTYLLHDGEDADAWVRVQVWTAYLVPGSESAVWLRDVYDNAIGLDDVTAAEAAAGDVTTSTVSLHNASADPITGMVCWIDAAVSGLEISDDGATWVAPTSAGAALALGNLAADAAVTLHLRRAITASAASDPEVLHHLHLQFNTNTNLDARGLYRIFNAAAYRFYRSNVAPPAEDDTPYATATSLPDTPADTFADGTWYLSMSCFDGVLDSGFLPVGPSGETYLVLTIASGAAVGSPPIGPRSWQVESQAGGVVRVVAMIYVALDDDDAPDDWAIAYTVDGGDPPEDTPDATATIIAGGLAVLIYDLPAQANGTTVKVRLQTRRNDGDDETPVYAYSAGSTIKSITADASAPAAPPVGVSWTGLLPREV